MTKAQYRASQSLLGNKMSKRDTERLIAMLSVKSPYREVITLEEYLNRNPEKLVRRFITKKGYEMVDYIQPDGRNGQCPASCIRFEKIYLD